MNHTKATEPTKRKVGKRIRLFCPIADCPDAKATQQGYATRRSYERHFKLYHVQGETIAFISRSDWGSPGSRVGLQKRAAAECRLENVPFVVFGGGMVSFPHLRKELTDRALDKLWHEIWGDRYSKEKKPPRSERVDDARDKRLRDWADELATFIPKFKDNNGRPIRIYLVTSPAVNYDGPIGRELAHLLVKRRRDIRYQGEIRARIPLKRQNKVLGILVPEKASWRSKYFSTAVDRMIEDEENQTSEKLPDLWVIGCTASSIQRPQGEKKRPYISLPALHRLQGVHTAENQVGIRFVEFTPDSRDFLVRTYNYKDLTAREREFIPTPKQASEVQQQVVAAIKTKGPHTIGMLEDVLRIQRTQISAEITALNSSRYRPRIEFDEDSQRYDFDPDWIQRKLVYPRLPTRNIHEDKILAFGCLHAGSTFSEYLFFVNEVSQLMLRRGSTVLVGAGDLIQGLEHDLDRRGEVMPGFNNWTIQEMLSSHLLCSVLIRVFEVRLDEALQATKNGKLSGHRLEKAVSVSLPAFLWIEGNHDAWVRRRGHDPLATFSRDLVSCLAREMWNVLSRRSLNVSNLLGIAEAHVCQGEVQTLPSGLGITILHPGMARAKTSSLRAQEMLQMAVTPVVVGANFHIAVNVEQWESDLGQRIAQQVGSIVWKTDYEHGHLKTLDVGVGTLRVVSHNGKILLTETSFFGEGTEGKEYGKEFILANFLQSLGVGEANRISSAISPGMF